MVTVVFLCLALVIVGLAPLMDRLSDRVDPSPWGRAFAATVLYVLVASTYEVTFLVARGQTPGKDLMNVRVIELATGEPPGWWVAIVRTVPFAILRLVPGAWIGAAACAVLGVSTPFDSRRRGIHDRLAGTATEAYDADVEEAAPEVPDIDREAFARRYGPRSIWSLLMRRVERR